MTLIVDVSEKQVMAALGRFLQSFLDPAVVVLQAQINRVSEPKANDFVTMIPTARQRLELNTHTYNPLLQSNKITQPTQISIQLDVHGPNGANNAQMISTLFRDPYCSEQFKKEAFEIQPLYCSDPRQIPFINGEQQYEYRWVIGCEMQFNPSVIPAQQFFTKAFVNLIDVDAEYPPV